MHVSFSIYKLKRHLSFQGPAYAFQRWSGSEELRNACNMLERG